MSKKWHAQYGCVCDEELRTVAIVTGRDISDEERARRAKLIAAAPELLEVAQHVVDSATIETPGALLDMAQAALAKAR